MLVCVTWLLLHALDTASLFLYLSAGEYTTKDELSLITK